MKVKEVIEKLKTMDQEAEADYLWDGELRTGIDMVYMGKTGMCVIAPSKAAAYSNGCRPKDAPDDGVYWETPSVEPPAVDQ